MHTTLSNACNATRTQAVRACFYIWHPSPLRPRSQDIGCRQRAEVLAHRPFLRYYALWILPLVTPPSTGEDLRFQISLAPACKLPVPIALTPPVIGTFHCKPTPCATKISTVKSPRGEVYDLHYRDADRSCAYMLYGDEKHLYQLRRAREQLSTKYDIWSEHCLDRVAQA
jgi:hypothetical protein